MVNKGFFTKRYCKRNLEFQIYTTSSCSIRTKNKANIRPGKKSVTTGVEIGGKNAAVINLLLYKFVLLSIKQ